MSILAGLARQLRVGDARSDLASRTASYGYLANTALGAQIAFNENTTPVMTTTKTPDFLNRLGAISSTGSRLPSAICSAYGYNNANQRTRVDLADGSYWMYS